MHISAGALNLPRVVGCNRRAPCAPTREGGESQERVVIMGIGADGAVLVAPLLCAVTVGEVERCAGVVVDGDFHAVRVKRLLRSLLESS